MCFITRSMCWDQLHVLDFELFKIGLRSSLRRFPMS